MLFQRVRIVVSCALAVLMGMPSLPAETTAHVVARTPVAANPQPAGRLGRGGGVLAPSGAVKINGISVHLESAVLGGERVVTESNSVAHITTRGSLALLEPNSAATYFFRTIKVDSGSVTVTTNNGMEVMAASLVVTPAPTNGRASAFEVSNHGGTVSVTAESGNVSLSDGTLVAENTTVTRTLDEQQQQPQDQGDQTGSTPARTAGLRRPPPAGATQNRPPCRRRFKDKDVNVCLLALLIAGAAFAVFELTKGKSTPSGAKMKHDMWEEAALRPLGAT